MRFIHTADWHLGRLFHGVHLTEDQSYVLDQLVDICREERPDALVVAGDIYDRAVPPPEAVSLLDQTLGRIVVDLSIPTILIAGNHDSPDRLHFGARVFANQRLHVFGVYRGEEACVTLGDGDGPVRFHCIPYIEPPVVRGVLQLPEVRSHDDAARAAVARLGAGSGRDVLVAHWHVEGALTSSSERPLATLGAETVGADVAERFSYTALGHLHRPQYVGNETIRYAGAPLKYSFAEVGETKSVSLVEIDAQGHCRVEEIPLTPRRDLAQRSGSLIELLNAANTDPQRDCYLKIELTEKRPVLNAMARLREVYPHLLQVERTASQETGPHRPVDHRALSETDLFSNFFEHVTGEALGSELRGAFEATLGDLRQREREV